MSTSTYTLTGLHCVACKKNAERIANQYGKDAVADIGESTLTLSHEWELDITSLKADLQEMNYTLVL